MDGHTAPWPTPTPSSSVGRGRPRSDAVVLFGASGEPAHEDDNDGWPKEPPE
jgi:hypothetical protein